MSDRETRALLIEALDFLNDHPNFSLRRDPRRTSYDLAARIDEHLAQLAAPPHPAIAEARERWAATPFLRVDEDERTFEQSSDGFWVRGWILIGLAVAGEIKPALRARYAAAIADLPEMTRQVFLAHRVEGLDYVAIAERFDIIITEVQHHVAEAIAAITRFLDEE